MGKVELASSQLHPYIFTTVSVLAVRITVDNMRFYLILAPMLVLGNVCFAAPTGRAQLSARDFFDSESEFVSLICAHRIILLTANLLGHA